MIAEVAQGTADDVARAVDAVRTAAPSWGDTTPGERAAALLALADRLEAAADELATCNSA